MNKKIIEILVKEYKFKELSFSRNETILERNGIKLAGSVEVVNDKVVVNKDYVKYMRENDTNVDTKMYIQFFRGKIVTVEELRTVVNVMHRC